MEPITKVGRPSDYTQELADKICALLAEGASMRSISNLEGFPSCETMFRWIREKPEFREQYARAKEESADLLVEMMMNESDLAIDGAWKADPKAAGAVVQGHRLKVDTLKWTASKLKPKKYGDKVDVTSDGKAIEGNTIVFKNFSETQPDSK